MTPKEKQAYNEYTNAEILKFANNEESDVYLALQPIYNLKNGVKKAELEGLAVLLRKKDGTDTAPMPALKNWQLASLQKDKTDAVKLVKRQLNFTEVSSKKLNDEYFISVNIRADELLALDVAEYIVSKVKKGVNLLVEITEYAPITETAKQKIKELKELGV